MINKNNYDMNINLISSNKEEGENLKNSFMKKVENIKVKTIFDCWKWIDNLNQSFDKQIEIIFTKFLNFENSEEFESIPNECLVVISNESETKLILEKMNKDLKQKDFMPLTLFLYKEKFTIKVEEEYPNIDPRTIFIENLSYFPNGNEYNPIEMILMRFCSVYNELGEKFSIGEKEEEISYDLAKNHFPFYLNILCLGKFRQGKSTTVNCILNEIKARETQAGTSQTRKITFYEVDNNPIKIWDLPGFQNEESIKNAVNKIKELNKGMNDSKDKFHIILYIFSSGSLDIFQDDEFLIFQELAELEEAKIIYLFTHSTCNNQEEIIEIIKKVKRAQNTIIKNGIKNLKEKGEQSFLDKQRKIEKKMEISQENLVLVNFHKNKTTPKLGINDLFKTINQLFQKTTTYIHRNEDRIRKGEQLKIAAKKELKSNLIGGTLLGVVPLIDMLGQEKYIKPSAIKKASNIFNLDYNKIVEEEIEYASKVANVGSKGACGIVGGVFVNGVKDVSKTVIKNVVEKVNYPWYYFWKGTETVNKAIQATEYVSNTALKGAIGVGAYGFSALFGLVLGYYSTSKKCDEIIDKLYNYYIKDSSEIGKSYEQAVNYLSMMEQKYQPDCQTSN